MADTTDPYPHVLSSPDITILASKLKPTYTRTSFSSVYHRSTHTTIPTPTAVSTPVPGLRRHSQSRGHGHNKSVDAQHNPLPLPLPTSTTDSGYSSNKEGSNNRSEAVIRKWRSKHNETISSSLSTSRSVAVSLLPDNPKLWTPAQLAQYLLTALRFKGFKSSEAIIVPKPVAHDIANFVIKCKLNGRIFLRLTDKDIEKWGVNKLWGAALLSSSCELRKSLLKGRIWGFSPEEEEFIGTQPVRKPERRIPSTVMEQEGLASPGHSNVPPAPAAFWPRNLGDRPWVDLPQSPSLGFESDASSRSIISSSAARPRALSTSSIASSAVGRVQRMIRKLEQGRDALDVELVQSNDESCLASDEMTSESEDDREGDVAWNTAAISSEAGGLSNSSDTHGMVHVHPESIWTRPLSFPVNSRPNTSGITLIETPLLLRSTDSSTIPQLARSSNSPHRDFSEANSITLHEEPTVETLLREERGIQEKRPLGTSWGAEAWEEDFPGGTSRRIPAATPAARASSRPSTDDIQKEAIVIPRDGWNDLCKRLGETERRLGMLERQEAERGETAGKLQRSKTDNPDELQAPAPGNLSPRTLPSYLMIVGVGVCTLAAQFLAERMIGRRPHF